MTYLRFRNELVDDVLEGEKRITARWDVDRDIAPGDVVSALDEQDRLFAELEIVHVTPLPADRFVDLVDVIGYHRTYEDVEELIEELESYYYTAKGRLGPKTTLHVLFFDVAGVAARRGVIVRGDSAEDEEGSA